MSLTLEYFDVPMGAQENMTVSGTGQPFNTLAGLVSGKQIRTAYATLEPGVWTLDGTRKLLADTPAGIAWWSGSRSGEDGKFAMPPMLEICFPEVYSTTGFTFTFSPETNQWCSRVQADFYNGQTLIAQLLAEPDQGRYIWQQPMDSFDRIVFHFLETNQPGQFAKLRYLQIGQVTEFGTDELKQVKLLNETDPSLCELTADTMTAEVYDRKNRQLRPQENQKVVLYRDGEVVAVQYLRESSRQSQRQYLFTCQSAIGLLEDDFLGGIYQDMPAQTLLNEVLEGVPFSLAASLADSTLTGYLPVCTRREALQQIAFAIGAMVTTRADGVIRLQPVPKRVSHSFLSEEIFAGATLETGQRIARYEVLAHSYRQSEETETLVEEETMAQNESFLLFEEPHHSYTVSGGQLLDSGANWVRIRSDGPVTVSAKKYRHRTVLHTRQDAAAVAVERGNVLRVEAATLVSGKNVTQVLARLYSSGQLRQTLSQRVVVRKQEVGDRVVSQNPWGTRSTGIIAAMESVLTQSGHTAQITIRGMESKAEAALQFAGQFYAGNREVLD